MAITVEIAFLILGGIIVIGYFGELLSKRFAIPTALLLLVMGYGLKLTGFVDVGDFIGIQDLFGSLALIVLLFDGGMSLNIMEVLFKSGKVLVVGLLITVFSMIGAAALFYAFGFDPLIGAILGAIAGGIGSSTTISIAKSISIPEEIRNFLTLESSITDIFSIILALVLTQALISGILDIQVIAQGIVGKFAIGIFIGLITGIAAMLALSRIEKGYNYMVTFAMVLLLYSVAEFLNGSGAIAVLAFGLVIGNETLIRKIIHSQEVEGNPLIQQFQKEISFFIRTFFFVFLGIVVTLGNAKNFALAFMAMVMLYIIRYAVIKYATANSPHSKYRNIL
ncbi:MAG TPA: cation:proton antiporter, partial [archaeon]|nr:cation:proton antiporter [archaeon]